MSVSRIFGRLLAVVAFAVPSFLATGLVCAGYEFVTIDVAESTDTEIWGVTDNGLASGFFNDPDGNYHGLLWKQGHMKRVDHPNQGPYGTFLWQANNQGHVAGYYADLNGNNHAVVYNSITGEFKQLPDFPGAPFNAAGGINSQGDVAGNYSTDPNQTDDFIAWVFVDGRYLTSIDPLSDQTNEGTITQSINDNRQFVGYYFDAAGNYHGYVKSVGLPYRTINFPGAQGTQLFGINNFGAVTGHYLLAGASHGHGFLLHDGKFTTFDFPGAAATWVTTINNHGDLGGFYEDAAGNRHGWVARYVD